MHINTEKLIKFVKPAVSVTIVCAIVFAAVINCANDSKRVAFGFEAQSGTEAFSDISEVSDALLFGSETEEESEALPGETTQAARQNETLPTGQSTAEGTSREGSTSSVTSTTDRTVIAPPTTTIRYYTTTRITLSSLFSKSSYVNNVISITNSERRSAGLSSLAKDYALMNAAQTRAEECASLDSIRVNGQAHKRPDGSAWYTVLGVAQNYNYGENTGQGCDTPEYMMEIWMASEGHKANILKKEYTKIGVGCAVSEDGTVFCVQIFYQP